MESLRAPPSARSGPAIPRLIQIANSDSDSGALRNRASAAAAKRLQQSLALHTAVFAWVWLLPAPAQKVPASHHHSHVGATVVSGVLFRLCQQAGLSFKPHQTTLTLSILRFPCHPPNPPPTRLTLPPWTRPPASPSSGRAACQCACQASTTLVREVWGLVGQGTASSCGTGRGCVAPIIT